MIRDRPHRLDVIYINQPLYFVTFAARDRRRIRSLDRARVAIERYGHRGIAKFSVALGRYVIMPDHVHLFVRGGPDFTLSSWVGGLKRAMSVALKSPRLWQPGFFDHVLRSNESYSQKWNYARENPVRAGLVKSVEDWPYQRRNCLYRSCVGSCSHRPMAGPRPGRPFHIRETARRAVATVSL